MYLSKENGDFVKDVLNLPEETGYSREKGLVDHVLDNLNIFTSPKLKWEKTTLIFSYSIDGHVMILGSFLKSCFCFDGN